MKKINLKNKSKKKQKRKFIKVFLFIFIIFISSYFTTKYLLKNNDKITSKQYVNYLLDESYNKSNSSIIKSSIKLLTNIDLSNPSTLLDKKIKSSDYDLEYEKDAKSSDDDYDTSLYETLTSYISNPLEEKQSPIVYIYNSHQLETYSNLGLENVSITPNVMMASYLLAENLNKYNINTIVEDTNIAEFIRISNLESDAFYSSTRIFLKNIMDNNPSIKYFIDIHRDSVSKDISTCTINNKDYARILFVLGASNENAEDNKKIIEELDKISDELYPGLSRGIYEKSTPNWSLVYNQDLNPGVMLIEVGGKENTIEEVMNTTLALTEILKKYIEGN